MADFLDSHRDIAAEVEAAVRGAIAAENRVGGVITIPVTLGGDDEPDISLVDDLFDEEQELGEA